MSAADGHTSDPTDDGGPADPASRGVVPGGRDLPVAVASGAALGALVLGSLLFVQALFVVVVAVAMAVACWELGRGLRRHDIDLPLPVLYVGCVAVVGGAYVGGPDLFLTATALSVLASLLWLMRRGIDGFVRNATATVFAVAYVPFLAGFVSLLLSEDKGVAAVITFIAVTVSSDIGGYFAGSRFGRHALSPVISPKKTWEGAAGSALLSTVVAVALVTTLLDGPWWVGFLLGPFVVVTATLGDLVISVTKRDLGIKDMSQIIPGHGGLMDRLDSLLATVAPVWVILHYTAL